MNGFNKSSHLSFNVESCNIPKRCNCSEVPQFENFNSFSSYYNLNMTSVNEALLIAAPWTFDSVNQTCECKLTNFLFYLSIINFVYGFLKVLSVYT